jgi:hypothetical protein
MNVADCTILANVNHALHKDNAQLQQKVKLSLCKPRRHMGGMKVQLHAFLTSSLDRSKVGVKFRFMTYYFIPEENSPNSHSVRGRFSPSTELGASADSTCNLAGNRNMVPRSYNL